MTHFSVRHLLLAHRRCSSIGHPGRGEETIARAVSCSDFRDSSSFAFCGLRRLVPCWAHGPAPLERQSGWYGLIMMWRIACTFSYKTATCLYTSDTIPTARVLVGSRFDRVSFGLHVSMRVGARPEDIALSLQRVKCASKPMC